MPSRKFILKNPDDLRAGQIEGENINYHDFEPDISIDFYGTIKNFEIDIDEDSIPDFILYLRYGQGNQFQFIHIHITPERNNLVLLCDHEEHNNYTGLLYKNWQISDNFKWTNAKSFLIDYVYWDDDGLLSNLGHFKEGKYHNTDVDLGLCLMDNEDPQYAWLTIRRLGYYEIIIKKFGYDVSSSGVEIADHQKFNLHPNPAKTYITLTSNQLTNSTETKRLTIYNKLGSVIDVFSFEGSEYRIELSDYSPGIYFCIISFSGKQTDTKKFVVY